MPFPNHRVFVTRAEVLVPPAIGLVELTPLLLSKQSPTRTSIKETHGDISFENVKLLLNPIDKYYPPLRDAKSMRNDVIAMCMCLGKMLNGSEFDSQTWQDVPLFMATGPNASGMASEIEEICQMLLQNLDVDEGLRNKNIYSEIHPLFALKGLTNSAQAYAAQLFGFRGHNATYGSTSYGTYLAFNDAVSGIRAGEFSRAVVGASNGGGQISQVMNAGMNSFGRQFCESPVAVSLVLEAEESVVKNDLGPRCEIINISASKNLPELNVVKFEKPYVHFADAIDSTILFSGAMCEESYKMEIESLQTKSQKHFSLYPHFGSTGCASFLINIAVGYQLIHEKIFSSLDCLNRDPYTRESWVHLGTAK